MPRALDININVTGLTAAQAQLQQLAGALRGMGGGGVAGGGGGAGGAIAQAVQRATRTPPSQVDRIAQALFSTRMNFGGASPLVGRTLQALGLPTKGVEGLIVGGTVAALAGFTMAVKAAADGLNELGDAMRLTGGTGQDVAGMARFGFRGAAGAGAAAAFRQRITSDPIAMMMAGQLGIHELPRPFGSANEARAFSEALRKVSQIADQETRLNYERALGIEQIERYVDLSPPVKAALDAQIAFEEKLAAGGGVRAANDLSVSLEMLKQSLVDLAAATLPGPIKNITFALNTITAALHGDYVRAAEFFNELQRASDPFGTLGLPAGPAAKQTDALKENTQALDANTANWALLAQRGMIGGGGRVEAALPTGWSGHYLARQMESGALGRGAAGG